MFAIIGPAKSMRFGDDEDVLARAEGVLAELPHARFAARAGELVHRLRTLSAAQLGKLLHVSDALAKLNHTRFAQFKADPSEAEVTSPALFAFDGAVFKAIKAREMDAETLRFAQQRLRIVSGLYGLLKPLELIQPYRLDMGTRGVPLPAGMKTLYQFHKPLVSQTLAEDMKAEGVRVLVNLASQEYFKAVEVPEDVKVVTCVFLNGGRNIAVHAKHARGLMVRYMMEKKVAEEEQLKEFDWAGYVFDEQRSSEEEFVFGRSKEDAQEYAKKLKEERKRKGGKGGKGGSGRALKKQKGV